MITRQLQSVIENRMFQGKAIIVTGARQVGKTTLFQQILQKRTEKTLSLNCDEPEVKDLLANANAQQLRLLIGDAQIVVIDEAQRVPGIGMTLKRITDNHPHLQLLVTGSSSFELQDKLSEPLTGRKFEYHLFPISTAELYQSNGYLNVQQQLESRLIYGSYPDILNHQSDAKELLMNVAGSYLYKDLLSLDSIRRPQLLEKLLQALALQVGSEVSYNELAQTIGSNSKTVEQYVDLLEKCFVVFRLNAFRRNVRNELKKSKKVYFYDNGIRNAILQNFSPSSLRADMGALWENFIVCELMKRNEYERNFAKSYFWRTTAQQKIDYIEERDGRFTVYEMKWNPKKAKTTLPAAFLNNYPVERQTIITPDNYLDALVTNCQ